MSGGDVCNVWLNVEIIVFCIEHTESEGGHNCVIGRVLTVCIISVSTLNITCV